MPHLADRNNSMTKTKTKYKVVVREETALLEEFVTVEEFNAHINIFIAEFFRHIDDAKH